MFLFMRMHKASGVCLCFVVLVYVVLPCVCCVVLWWLVCRCVFVLCCGCCCVVVLCCGVLCCGVMIRLVLFGVV